MYQEQWIPQDNFQWNDLLIDQISFMMDEWKATNEYSKTITTELMHDESNYKHLQTIKSKVKKKTEVQHNKSSTGILKNKKLARFIKSLYDKKENLQHVWNNSLDGHVSCYGTSCVESTHLFEKCRTLLNKHSMGTGLITLLQLRFMSRNSNPSNCLTKLKVCV